MNYAEISKLYRFSVYKHHLVLDDNRLIIRQFIVLKDFNNNIIAFTKFHNYIHTKNNRGAKSLYTTGNNRFAFVAQFLNYILIENYTRYKIGSVSEISISMIQDFFRDYGISDKKRTKSTVDQCANAVIDFLGSYISKNKSKCVLHLEDFLIEKNYRNKRGRICSKNVPNFEIYYSGKSKQIFRDMPNSVFNLIFSYAAQFYPEIFFLIALSAFAGLRPSEACNVHQAISPLGSGIIFEKSNGVTKKITLDLLEEKNLRSDLKPVGRIKKERKQQVYPQFLQAFEVAYEMHLKYLSTCKFEPAFCPMNVNARGMAMTYDTYVSRFKKMIKSIIPILLQTGDPEIELYAHNLLEHSVGPHIFRHWFSVQLVLYGEDVAGLQYWRGDRSPESALNYLRDKGELVKQLSLVNNILFDFSYFESENLALGVNNKNDFI